MIHNEKLVDQANKVYLDGYQITYPDKVVSGALKEAFDRCKEANDKIDKNNDPVNSPNHYRSHPSGVECIQIVEHMNFCRGNAIKYIWRAGEKGDEIEYLKKAAWYINREIKRLELKRLSEKPKVEAQIIVEGVE